MRHDIRVTGIRYPNHSIRRRKRRSVFVGPIRLRSLVWVLAVGSLVWGIHSYGTPHLRFAYTYHSLQPAPPFIEGQRFYIRCDYIGWNSQRISPRDGRCPLIRFLH